MTVTPGKTGRSGRHWPWFLGGLGVLGAASLPVVLMMMFALTMITDPCHGDESVDRVCRLSLHGQFLLIFVPPIALVAATATALAAAAVATRYRRSALWGLLGWPVGGVVAAALANELCYVI